MIAMNKWQDITDMEVNKGKKLKTSKARAFDDVHQKNR